MRFYVEMTKSLRRWGIVFLLLVLIAILVFSIMFAGRIRITSRSARVIPVSIQSNLPVNYHRDPFGVEIPVLDLGLIEEAILDQQPGDEGAPEHAEDIVSDLLTPVPSVTPTNLPTATALFEPTSTQTGSNPGASATAPSSSSPTSISTSPAWLTVTNTPSPPATQPGQGLPTSTYTPTTTKPNPSATPSASPSATTPPSATPTATKPPTSSPTTVPSPTPEYSASPVPNLCSLLNVSQFEKNRKQVRWTISNNSAQTILLTGLFIDWPSENVKLKKIKLDNWTIWDDEDRDPPTGIYSNWRGSDFRREIRAGESEVIVFEFDQDAALTGYFLQLTFDSSCTISADR